MESTRTSSYEAEPGKIKKVVLLYSGGLDTSVIVKWIQEKYKAQVVTVTADIGQPVEDLEAIRQKALKLGAVNAYIIDAKDEFADEYITKAIKSNALYQGQYPLATAIGRYLLAKIAIEIAEKEKADCIAHGCTGKGNDQVRIEGAAVTLKNDIKVLAPIRDWNMLREEEYEYAEKHGIQLDTSKKSPYSCDENLWGKSSECGPIEDQWLEPPADVYKFVTLPEKAPDKAEYVELEFEKGIPVKLNGKKMKLSLLIMELNKIGARNGVGIINMVEDRTVGLKSREVYEAPAAVIIIAAHHDLEKYVCTIDENQFKVGVDEKWAYMTYTGLWFDPLMDALNAFCDVVNEKVVGKVKIKLYKGSYSVVGRESKFGLYDKQMATYNKGSTFNIKASPGFIELWTLSSKMGYQVKKRNK